MVGLAVVVFFLVIAALAPWIAPHDPLATSWSAVRAAPSAAYLFGADELGRDVLSRIIWGARASILAGVVSVSISLALGVPIGMAAGYLGRWVDALISRITDAMLACPFLILAIALAAFLGPSLTNAMIAIGISATPIFIRLTRAQVLAAKSEDYVEAARALGNPHLRIALRHIFPNIVAPLIVQATLAIAAAVIAEASSIFSRPWASSRRPRAGAACSTPRATTSTRRRGWRSGPACRSSCWCCPSTCSATACATRWTRATSNPQAPLHIRVCSFDQLHQSRSIDLTFGPELHMAHEPAGAFQQALRIGNLGTPKEPDIDVSPESIDIGEGRVTLRTRSDAHHAIALAHRLRRTA